MTAARICIVGPGAIGGLSTSELVRKAPVCCAPDTPLREVLQTMQARRIGSMLVTDPAGRPLGILTRFDILGRVTLAEVPLTAPVSQVMVQPVQCLSVAHTAQDAALLMSRQGIRHVPVTRDGVVVGSALVEALGEGADGVAFVKALTA